jgi:hypothetical protein
MAAYCDQPSDLMPWLHADSGCSEKVLSPEQQFAGCNREVQSRPKISEWERTFASESVNPGSMINPVGCAGDPLLHDILMY